MQKMTRVGNKSITRLNVGGTIFECYENTLKTFRESVLARLDTLTDNYNFERDEYFFDRNPLIFAYILDSYRRGAIHLPKDMCGTIFKEELEFWGLSPSHVAPCCWEALYKSDDDIATMKTLLDNIKQNTNTCLMVQENTNSRKQVWLFLDEPSSSRPALVWVSFISILIVATTITVALATLPMFTVKYTESERKVVLEMINMFQTDNKTAQELVDHMKPHPYLVYTDVVCHIILTLEILLSFIMCPKKKTFAASLPRIAIVLGYLSFWVALAMESNLSNVNSLLGMRAYVIVKHMNVLKLARLMYLAKRIPAFNIMGLTLCASKQELKILVFMLGILACVFGFVMFVAEFFQESNITNAFVAMYWALITLTTVGYGNYVPDTAVGHVIAGACAICGVICLALPIGVIASSFYTFYNYHKYVEKHVKLYGKQSSALCSTDEKDT